MRMVAMSVCAMLLLASVASAQSVRYVDDNAPAGGDGLAWATAYKYLQDALAEAAASGGTITEIRVGQGTYWPDQDELNPAGTGDRLATFVLVNGVALRGGYEGQGAVDPDIRDTTLFPSFFDGDLLENDLVGANFIDPTKDDNTYHIVTGSGNDSTALIEGFIIRNGVTEAGVGDEIYGGGMIIISGSPTISDCTFLGNMGEWGGGLYAFDGSMPSLTDCLFDSNFADEAGGGMMIEKKSNASLMQCNFTNNLAAKVGGGGLFVWDRCHAAIQLCIFTSNSCTNTGTSGGGIRVETNSLLNLVDSEFHFNTAASSGGGVAHLSGSLSTFLNCLFIGNEAINRSGGGVRGGSWFDGCTFQGNQAGDDGAGISGSPSFVRNCLFQNNVSDRHGGAMRGTPQELVGCDFIGNTANSRGGALYPGGSISRISDCLFDGNSAIQGGAMYVTSPTSMFVVNCSFLRNDGEKGGGVFNTLAGDITYFNCEFIANSVVDLDPAVGVGGRGGAIMNRIDVNCNLYNCTIAFNTAEEIGGGIMNGLRSTLVIANSIIWGNLDDGIDPMTSQIADEMSTASANQSCIQVIPAFVTGSGNITIDPDFVDPIGPDTIVGTGDENLRLLATSLCLDGGDNSFLSCIETDLDGLDRFVDDPVADSGIGAAPLVDMGAYERGAGPVLVNDCFANGLEDTCEIAMGLVDDCDGNGIPDICDLVDETLEDCNLNGVPDICDLSVGTLQDCDIDGIPDSCAILDELVPDCNDNGVPDSCDLATGFSPDVNGNSLPDECESPCDGDIGQNLFVDVSDLLALLGAWGPIVPSHPPDINGDGNVNVTDLLALLAAWGPCP